MYASSEERRHNDSELLESIMIHQGDPLEANLDILLKLTNLYRNTSLI